ncbi:MAG: cadherin-like domain-containing protein [Lentisphaeria bacterium]|nr:cadherin-like domain-containing protein [Lentisphaeria bacterium]
MTSNSTGIFRKIAMAALFCAAAVFPQAAKANWSLDMVSGSIVNGEFMAGNYIDGVSTKAAVQLYLTTDDNNMRGINFLIEKPANLSWDSIVWEDGALLNDAGKQPSTFTAAQLNIKIDAGVGKEAMAANTAKTFVGTVYYNVDTVDEANLGTSFVRINTAQSLTGGNYANKVAVSGPTAVSLVKGFNFKTVGSYEMDEDADPLAIAATDDQFECTTWDGRQLSPSAEVMFSAAEMQNGSEEAGSVAIKNGKIVFTPAEDFNGEAVISFTAKSTKAGVDATADGEVTIAIDPVDDPPVFDVTTCDIITFEGGAFKDGTSMTLNLLESTEVDGDKMDSAATLVLSADGYAPITLNLALVDEGQGSFSIDFANATDVVSYEAVKHPAATLAYKGVLTLTEITKDGPKPVVIDKDIVATINDTDRSVEITSFNVLDKGQVLSKLEVKADSELTYDILAVDPDEEDVVTTSVKFTVDEQEQAKQPELVKGTSFWAMAVVNSFEEEKEEGKFITVVNSVPAITAASPSQIFIQKGVATSGTSTITATDADNDDLTFIVVSNDTSKGTASFEGNVLTYTVKDAEASEVADTIVVKVNDGEADSATIEVTVLYCENPVPEITSIVFSTDDIPEVDEAGLPVKFTAEVIATDKAAGNIPAAVGDLTVETEAGLTAEVIATEGDATRKTYTVEFTTAGYGTVEHPDAANEIGILFKVIDDESKSYGTAVDSVVVVDKDCLPSAPTVVNRFPEFAFHGDSLIAEGAGAIDEDGDTVSYTYAWACSIDGGASYIDLNETGNTLSGDNVIKKGYMVKVTAVATTEPYGDGNIVVSEGSSEGIWTIGNTAPYFTKLGDQEAEDAEDDLEFTWVMDEDSDEVSINALALDVDAEDGVDSLTYAVSELDEEIGTLAIDAATGAITFKPAADFSTAALQELPSFEVTVTDESAAGATNTAKVYLQINEVNDKPVILAEDEYVQPDDLGADMSVDFDVVMGPASEEGQELTAAALVSIDDPDQILEADSVSVEIPAYSAQCVTLNYTVKEDAAFGKSAKVTFTVTDNGTPAMTSDAATVTIFVGATPWYPIISFDCADPEGHADGHTFHLEASDGSVYDLTVKGERTELHPGDYAAAGHPGYVDGVTVNATVFVWTMDEGTTDILCAEKEIVVTEYGLPYEPGLADGSEEDELVADENGWFTLPAITAPMAKSYTIAVKDNEGKVVKEIGPVDFEADADGMILPNIEGLALQLTEEGNYVVSIQGFNPNGEGEQADVVKVEVPQSSEKELKWSAGDFLPANGSVLTNGAVKFSWPVAAAADSYTVKIFDAYGYVVAEKSNISATNATFDLTISEVPETYSWTVTAVAGSKKLASDALNFTLAKTTSTVIVTKVTEGRGDTIVIAYEGILEEGMEVAYDYQYFSIEEMAWHNGFQAVGEVTADGINVTIDGVDTAAGDYVVLRLSQNGQQVGDWIAYQIQ